MPAGLLNRAMVDPTKRKTVFILALAFSLVIALVAIIADPDMRDRLGPAYYVLSLAIIGCVLLVLAGYVWDRTLTERLKTLRATIAADQDLESGSGEHDEIIGLARKIEHMAQTLQKTEASYRGIVEDQVDLICRHRPDGTLTFVNRACAEALGRKRSELLGRPLSLLPFAEPVANEPVTTERELVYPDGRRRWFVWTIRAITDQAGKTLEYQAVGHDITPRKEAEAALLEAKETAEAADRAKTEFLAIVSHEIRTPINGVAGFAQMLAASPLNPEQREQVAIIKSSADALEKLITDILDLSKIEAGQLEIEAMPFALRSCVDDVIAFFQPKARAAALTLTATIDPEVPAGVCGDQSRLRQVLTNLLSNALKFTDRGSIALRVSGARLEPGAGDSRGSLRLFFAITDTGIGIPAEKLAQLFQPFRQVDDSPTRRRSGTGLGLIIAKRLCELMGGTVSVESRFGVGTTFHFSIVVGELTGDTPTPFATKAATPRPGG